MFEEGADEICRNALSVGLDLKARAESGLLRFEAARPSLYGLEMHLARMHRDLESFRPDVVVIDPISAFRGPGTEFHATLLRMLTCSRAVASRPCSQAFGPTMCRLTARTACRR